MQTVTKKYWCSRRLIRLSWKRKKFYSFFFEPNISGGGLNPDLLKLYEDTQYKNRAMFLTGERNTMDNLLRKAKEYKAIQRIIANMRSERVAENNPQFEMAVDREMKINLAFLQAARETFVKLYYPFQFKGVEPYGRFRFYDGMERQQLQW